MMANPTYEENLELISDSLACLNDKPVACYTGSATGPAIEGMTVAEFLEDPIAGVMANVRFLQRLAEDAGPIRVINSTARAMNMAVYITMLWNSRVLIPGIDISADSVWQVKEEQIIDRDDYDKILAMGYTEFVNAEIIPRIIDLDYLAKYQKVAAEGGPIVSQAYAETGIAVLTGAPSTMVPFEQLCGMRSMPEFFKDCYKILDKLKEVSDFIFAEKSAQTEIALESIKDNPAVIGGWVGGWRTASAMVNPQIWETLVWPYMKASAEQVIRFGKVAIMHLDSDWNRDIERFAELPAGQVIINTDGMTSMPRARQLLPKHTLMGDVLPALLTAGSPQQVTDYVNRLVNEVGPQGLIVCAGCDTPVNAKYENLVAMIKATNDWS